ncbi:MAG: serine/threonine-protein kinase [Thermoguttaceae bacterium]
MTQTGLMTAGGVRRMDAAVQARPARRARQWELVEFAAEGSLARIYRARPAGTPASQPAGYAVKMLRPEWQDEPEAIRLLQREALVGRSVSHPHLAPVLSAAVSDPPRLLVMPWLSGASLRARLDAGRRFDVASTLWIIRQAAEALDALHAAGWMHGDVSPGNLHLSPSGHVTLIDLSFAKRQDETGSVADRPVVGTFYYLAPEHVTSSLAADIRSDIYSLGAVMFEMLAGRVPFEGRDLAELALAHRESPPPDLARLAPEVPREVAHLVRRMLAKNPLLRPQTPRELIGRLVRLEVAAFSQRA